jgi:TPR repeat protein
MIRSAVVLAVLATGCAHPTPVRPPEQIVHAPSPSRPGQSDPPTPATQPSTKESECRARPADCAQWARAQWSRTDDGIDRPHLVDFYRIACEAGSGEGCEYLGEQYMLGISGRPDLNRAARTYERGCVDLKWPLACHEGGNLYTRRPLPPSDFVQDYAKAANLYQRGCDMDEPYSCAQLANLYRKGRGVPLDAEKARQILGRAQSLGFRAPD